MDDDGRVKCQYKGSFQFPIDIIVPAKSTTTVRVGNVKFEKPAFLYVWMHLKVYL
jgi:hypothetical protein